MKINLGQLLLVFLIATSGFAQNNGGQNIGAKVEGSALELRQIQVIPIKDSKTERHYELYIKLPKAYSKNPNKRYPVLYYTDAMWHLEMLSGATEYMLEDIILVGISWQLDIDEDLKKERGDHVSRFRDYSMSKHKDPKTQKKYQFGEAQNHLNFIRNDVITYVDHTYRTNPNSRTYFGYSMSGEFGAYILMTQPDTFNNYIIGSPTIKNEVEYLAELNTKFGAYKASNKNSSLKANVYISYGSLEDETVTKPIDAFVKMLNDRRDDGLAVFKEVIEGNHGTAFPTTAVHSVDWLASLMTHVSKDNYKVPFWEIPHLNKPFISTTPEDRKDGILVDTLAVSANNRNAILSLSQEIFEGQYGHYDALLISHKDKLVFESYYKKGRINLQHGQASATKGYTSLIVGRAIQLGYLTMEDLDKPIVHFLKDLDPSKFVDGSEKITLHKALTMQGGLTIDREKWKEIEKDTLRIKGQGLVQNLLEQSAPITDESQKYLYGNFNPMLVMTVIDAVVPGGAEHFIKNEVLDKLEISNYQWSTNPNGLPQAGYMTRMTSRDMLKWGSLVLHDGKLNDKPFISESYLKKATSGMVNPTEDWIPEDYRYGYFWYQTNAKVGNKTYKTSFAWGGGGQRVIVVEALDLTIIISGHDSEDDKIMKPIFEIVIPAFTK
ncbi:serine hydrolase [Pontimicrobium sp. IMCC45349]|uniref:serine hydrolase n=1 Tax=Pontimicrobium sp. IMCC45349 TaxID=3391574 RepID=UPI00399FFF57